jgi:hypothetical protein
MSWSGRVFCFSASKTRRWPRPTNSTSAWEITGRVRLPWRYTYWSIRSWHRSSFQAIRERKQPLNLTAIDVLAAVAVAVCYVALRALGEMMTRISPGIVPRRFSI